MSNKEIFAAVVRFFDGDDVPAKMIKKAFALSCVASKKELRAMKNGTRDEFASAIASVSGCAPIESWLKGLPYGLLRKVQQAGHRIQPTMHFVVNDAPVENPIAAAFAAAAKK